MSTAAVTVPPYAPSRPCPSCGREWGAGIACQFCDQVEGLPAGVHLSSPARRFGGYLLEGLLAVVTLGIGWLVWDSRNQELWDKVVGTVIVNDPQKQLLPRRVGATPEQQGVAPRSGPDALPFPPRDAEPHEAVLPPAPGETAES